MIILEFNIKNIFHTFVRMYGKKYFNLTKLYDDEKVILLAGDVFVRSLELY